MMAGDHRGARSEARLAPCIRLEQQQTLESGEAVLLLGGGARGGDPSTSELAEEEGAWGALEGKRGKVFGSLDQWFVQVQVSHQNNKTYPPSRRCEDVVVPRSCCFRLGKDIERREFVAHVVARQLGLRDTLARAIGIDNEEIGLRVALHLLSDTRSLLVLGGQRKSEPVSGVHCFLPSKATCLTVAHLPFARSNFAAVACGTGRLLLAGGATKRADMSNPSRQAFTYDALLNEFAHLPPLRVPREGCCGCAVGSRVFLFGGTQAHRQRHLADISARSSAPVAVEDLGPVGDAGADEGVGGGRGGALPSIQASYGEHIDLDHPADGWHVLDRERGKGWEADRSLAACVALRPDFVVVTGGQVPRTCSSVRNRYTFEYRLHTVYETVSSCECFDPRTLSFTPLAGMSERRAGHASCVWRGLVVVAGGRDEHRRHLSSVEAFDGETWTRLPDMRERRFSGSLCVWNGEMYAMGGTLCDGGFDDAGVAYSKTVEQYLPDQRCWKVVRGMKMPREAEGQHSIAVHFNPLTVGRPH